MFFLLVQIYFGTKETIGGIILSPILLHLNPTDLTDSSEEPSYMSQNSRNPNQHYFLTSFLPQSHHAGDYLLIITSSFQFFEQQRNREHLERSPGILTGWQLSCGPWRAKVPGPECRRKGEAFGILICFVFF